MTMFGHLIPVLGERECLGSLLRTARGYRAFDSDDREIGTYPTVEAGAAALLNGNSERIYAGG
jgi:hypothetical protein